MSNLINLGLSGLNAAQWGLTTTGQNISNASTPGYSIETPVYAESGGQYTGSGYLPQGVSTVTVTRQYSQYLTTELNNAQSSSSSLSTYNTLISQLNNLIGSPTSGIASAITGYFTGLQNVSNNASSLATRQTAMSGAQTLANQINAAGEQYDALRQSVNTQLSNTVSQINSYSEQIAQLNGQIRAASTQGQPPNQLLDQRDLAVSNLSQLIGVNVVNSNGSYSVFMSNGQPLVSSGNSYNLGHGAVDRRQQRIVRAVPRPRARIWPPCRRICLTARSKAARSAVWSRFAARRSIRARRNSARSR